MKFVIASDIHGSAIYCEKLLERFKEEKADRMLLLGDVLYHGPRNDLPDGYAPKKVIEMLNSIKECVTSVAGNCEAPVDQYVLKFPVLAEYALIFHKDIMIYATHGDKNNISFKPPLPKGSVLLYGHTHVPLNTVSDGIICLNPGSVSIPKEESKRGYMTLDENGFAWKDLDGNLLDTREI